MSHLEELRQDRRVTDDDVLRARIAVLDNHIRLLSQKRRVEVHSACGSHLDVLLLRSTVMRSLTAIAALAASFKEAR